MSPRCASAVWPFGSKFDMHLRISLGPKSRIFPNRWVVYYKVLKQQKFLQVYLEKWRQHVCMYAFCFSCMCAHRWQYVFLDFGYFGPRFTMFLCFFLPNLFETPFFVSLEQSQNKFDKRCRISAGLFPRNTWVRHVHWNTKQWVRHVHGCGMYRSSPLRSTLNTGYITGLDMCKVCTEAVHCVALWTRVTSQVWTCLRYVPKQSTA